MRMFDRDRFAKASKKDEISIDVPAHDWVNQRLDIQRVVINERGIRFYPAAFRYAWHSEMDLMARLAGMNLRHRWGRWNQEPFTPISEKHISVYERDV